MKPLNLENGSFLICDNFDDTDLRSVKSEVHGWVIKYEYPEL